MSKGAWVLEVPIENSCWRSSRGFVARRCADSRRCSCGRVLVAVRAAMAPALPFPASDEFGSLPADGKANDPWLVKPLQPGDRTMRCSPTR